MERTKTNITRKKHPFKATNLVDLLEQGKDYINPKKVGKISAEGLKTYYKLAPPDAILCADIHLREDTPICRTDNFPEAQWIKMKWLKDRQSEYGCPILCSGDLFHHWKPSPALLSKTIENIPDRFYTVFGNHDLPQHNMELSINSGVWTLVVGGHIGILGGLHWGQDIEQMKKYQSVKGFVFDNKINKEILVGHIFTYQQKEFWMGEETSHAYSLLKKYPEYDLIVTGDNHLTFVEELDGRFLVNPGSMTRQTAAQIGHTPSVFFWYEKDNTVLQVELPFEKDVISREHIEIKEKRDDRIKSFVENLETDWSKDISFEENLKKFENLNSIEKEIMAIVYKSMTYKNE